MWSTRALLAMEVSTALKVELPPTAFCDIHLYSRKTESPNLRECLNCREVSLLRSSDLALTEFALCEVVASESRGSQLHAVEVKAAENDLLCE